MRMPADPGASCGRTDGQFALLDERRPVGDRTVAVYERLDQADEDLRRAPVEP